MPPVVKNVLKSIGLSDKEILVVLTLLQGGPMFASEVANAAGLNRTTTYGLLKDLVNRGLVNSLTKKNKATRYQSIAPEMLPGYVERKQDELKEGARALEQAIPQINLLRNKGRVLPKVQYFEGNLGVEQAYEDMIAHNDGKKIYAFTGLEGALTGGLSQKFQDYFIAKRMREGITADYIVPETKIGKEGTLADDKKGRVAKFIPPEFDFNTEICVYDSRISIFSYSPDHPIALIIEDKTISHAVKQLFNYVWSIAK